MNTNTTTATPATNPDQHAVTLLSVPALVSRESPHIRAHGRAGFGSVADWLRTAGLMSAVLSLVNGLPVGSVVVAYQLSQPLTWPYAVGRAAA